MRDKLRVADLLTQILAVDGDGSGIDADKLDGVEGSGYATSGHSHSDYVAKATYDANTILKADSDDTPTALTVGEETLVGRITSGVITALTAAQARGLLGLTAAAAADITVNDCTMEGDLAHGAAGNVGFHGATPVAQQTVTGSTGSNAALQDLLTKLANIGIIVDSTT